MKAVHRTSVDAALQILKNGFDLKKFGFVTKKVGTPGYDSHARGIFLSEDWGAKPEELPPHPWDHRDRGVYIFGTVHLKHPLKVPLHVDGVFYQPWLAAQYEGKTGAKLTAALQRDGYDGIYVTDVGEITVFDPKDFVIDAKRSMDSIRAYQQRKDPVAGVKRSAKRSKVGARVADEADDIFSRYTPDYDRTIPRDLFNEADLLKCYGRLWILLHTKQINHVAQLGEEDQPKGTPFEICQNWSDGSLTVENVPFRINGQRWLLSRPLNSRNPWPLECTSSDEGIIERVFTDQGELSPEFLALIQG